MNKVKLFDDEDNNFNNGISSEIFDKGKKLSAKQTLKLIKLKSQIGNDPRFKINEQFIEDDNDDCNTEDHQNKMISKCI